ncbi:MAG: hypothetical protein E5V25_07845 [Mesorhizobium sp.]|nr:MAG: hypothetical protein E5V25_07845 [Mesorhizobium sp.]
MRNSLLVIAFVLAGCASQQSVKYVGPSGQYGSGSIAMSGTMANGRFSVSDQSGTCDGTFPSWSNLTITFPVRCTNGPKGTITLTRLQDGPLTATGVMVLDNGQTRQVVYGQAAS